MLTGLLAPSEGEARLFGETLDAGDMATRRRVGYMSQNFSLYSELTVQQNLTLHAQLFELPPEKIDGRVAEMLERFDLKDAAHAKPESLPLGMRQRLQLAVAVIHRPDLLILDEPTSGVDPVARDSFWRMLIRLSREDGVTIFIATHFMNEAERCDRISLMHAGKVLAMDAPAEPVKKRGKADLEQAFISYLEEATGLEAPPEGAGFVARRSSSIRRDSGPMHGARRWRSCATGCGSLSPFSEANSDFRRVLYTAKHVQVVLMSPAPGEEIGEEVHKGSDQFFRVEKGKGDVWIDGDKTKIKGDDAIVVPAGA